MLRSSLLYLSEQSWLRHWMETSRASRKLTARFVAGQTLADGVAVLKSLHAEGILATLDFLGENVSSAEDAAISRDNYLKALDEIQRAQLPATVSLKPTQFGLDISTDLCRTNIMALAERASAIGSRVEIDMEASAYTGRTLEIVSAVHDQFPGHVRAVIQAYLFRSESDIRALSARQIPVRLCKGAYREPATVAIERKPDVDANYLKLIKLLLAEGTYPAVASHDDRVIDHVLRFVSEQKIGPERFEFQMLYGIRRDLQRKLIAQGYRLRLYVPYGDAWYPYFMRRLAERPANLIFLAKNLLRA